MWVIDRRSLSLLCFCASCSFHSFLSITQFTHLSRWIRDAGLESPALQHLKCVHHSLSSSSSSKKLQLLDVNVPPLTFRYTPPPDLSLSEPYITQVPLHSALTYTSMALKNRVWTTVYAPRRRGEGEAWSRGKVQWARGVVRELYEEVERLEGSGEVSCLDIRRCRKAVG